MANYPVNKIRNVCLMGHGGDGKTSLVESLLNIAGVTDRVGKIADGNTVCDFDPGRDQAQVFHLDHGWSAPGRVERLQDQSCSIPRVIFDFDSEVAQCALRVAESAPDRRQPASPVPGVGTEKAWAHW